MKTQNVQRYSAYAGASLLVLAFIGFFQNCSPVNFSKDFGSSSLSSSVDGMGSDSVFYTNAKIVPVSVHLNSPFANQMRAGVTQNLENVPWQTAADKIMVDLGTSFASDGSKDGSKTIYLEAREKDSTLILKSQVQIFLDTQAPDIQGLGILTAGIQGRVINKGQNISVAWNIKDKMPANSQFSDIDPAGGFRWGLAQTNDCSESNLTSQSTWMPLQQGMSLSWPEADPLKSFYICLYAKDRAGNVANFLSQPMTSVWNVLAGDNSQGNGSSVTSSKVRFKAPSYLFQDPDSNIYIYDSQFVTWRQIRDAQMDAARTIQSATWSITPQRWVAYDSQRNAYLQNGSSIYVLPFGANQKAVKILEGLNTASVAIRKYQGTERLVILNSSGVTPHVLSTNSYLFEVPVSVISSLNGKTLSLATLLSSYKSAGNGIVPYSNEALPTEVILSAKDSSSDVQYSLGQGTAIATSDSGEIYFSTQADGNGRGWGHHSLRRLSPLADGKWKQTLLSRTTWIQQLSYLKHKKADGTETELLLASSAAGGSALFNLKTNAVTTPFTAINDKYTEGALITKTPGGADYEFYLSSKTDSRVYHYGSDFKLIELLGRPVFDTITDPLSSVLGNPHSVVQDPTTKETYILDSQNAQISKVSTQGTLVKVAGQVQKFAGKADYNDDPLSNFLLNSNGFTIGYQYQMAADFDAAKNRKILYVTAESGLVHALDLVNSKVSTVTKAVAGPVENGRFLWRNNAVAISKTPSGNSLYVARFYNVNSAATWFTPYVSFISKHAVDGLQITAAPQDFMGNILRNTNANNATLMNNKDVEIYSEIGSSVHVDEDGFVFISGSQLKISHRDGAQARVLPYSIGAFTVVKQEAQRYVIYSSGGKLVVLSLDMSTLFDATKSPVLSPPKKLCVPGTALGGVGSITQDAEGNLLIADSSNARILKYRIRTSEGALTLNYCN